MIDVLLALLMPVAGFPPAVDTLRRRAPVQLDTVTVVGGRRDDLIGLTSSASQGRVGAADLRSRPMSREGEMLETVPGVIVTQHSGDGKANQYFIRGFNLDHGTDFQTKVEGMPVNMASHAHGQGYTDLNFLIPELVDHIDYRLGVYHAELGDFGSAGGAQFRLVDRVARPFVSAEGGEHGMARIAGAGSAPLGRGDLLVGAEVKRYDGPWQLPQDLRKVSGLARYSWRGGSSRFSVLGLVYRNSWASSDQIPNRAVTAGALSRFGYIDPTDGGTTERYSLSGSWRHTGAGSSQEIQVYAIRSSLSLFSNFGYFLDDPTNGDQFNQRERRSVLGASAVHRQVVGAFGQIHVLKLGAETRADLIDDLGLFRTVARRRLGAVRDDAVRQTGSGAFVEAETRWNPWVRTVVGLRGDIATFSVRGDRPENAGHRTAGIVSPKASIVLSPGEGTELYLSGGFGFHSNDARGTTITVDPSTGDPAQRVDPLVRSRGAEIGLRVTPVANWRSTVSAWGLTLDGELLFVGDAGITEPSSPSRRLGVTFANFYRPVPSLAFDVDVSLAKARFQNVPSGADRIPGAIESVLAAGASWSPATGPFGAVRIRHFGAYPLIEGNSVRATPTTLLGADAGYRLKGGLEIRATVLNLLNTKASDIQYYYASRLAGEAAGGVEDIHFHPVEPRQVRLSLTWGF